MTDGFSVRRRWQQPADRKPTYRWFVTAKQVLFRRVGTTVTFTAMPPVHAKEMGTTQTACGLDATSWQKLWGQRFSTSATEACQQCVRVVEGTARDERPGLFEAPQV